MAFEYDVNETFRWAFVYMQKGLRIIKLHGIWPDGNCTCPNPECRIGGSLENSCGKHPVTLVWGDSWARTEDDILAWDVGMPFNLGVILGPDSGHGPDGGYIDVEDDNPEARAFRESLGMTGLDTPTWTSGKSTHQLLAWDDKLSSCKGKIEPGGLECRLGAGSRQIQSVLPPSWHRFGVKYEWKTGMSIDDVEVAPAPRSLVNVCVNHCAAGGSNRGGEYKGPLVYREVQDGEGRHRSLLLWAWDKILAARDPLGASRREIIIQEVLDSNELHIKPPKTRDEVLKIVNSCFEHYRRKTQEEGWEPTEDDESQEAKEREIAEIGNKVNSKTSVPVSGLEAHGLERYQVGNSAAYRPGNWSVQMIHGDPPEIVLCVPAWENTPCRGRIRMSFDTFRSAAKVASTVFAATRRVILDGDTAKWRNVWKGQDASKKTGGESIIGIMEQLMMRKGAEDDIYVGASGVRYAQLAAMLLKAIRKAKVADEDKPEPNESGKACWVNAEECWFQWAKVWDDIGRNSDVLPGERNRVRARLLEALEKSDFIHKRWRFGTMRPEYVVFTEEWVDALERMASADHSLENPSEVAGVDGQLAENAI